jgi:hypothetical protein
MAGISNIKLPALNWRRSFYALLLVTFQWVNGQPIAPKFEPFQPFNLTTGTSPSLLPPSTAPINGILQNDPYRDQNIRIMQQSGMTLPRPINNRQESVNEVNRAINDELALTAKDINELRLESYQNNFRQFLQLNPDSFSITRAIYLSESAYYDNPPPFKEFEAAIKQCAAIVRQTLRKEGLSEKDGLAVNYAIQKLYRQNNEYIDSNSKSIYLIKKLEYDFDDFMADKDWRKMCVTKLLQTGTGQCHSLPLLYLCIAEQFHIKAYLSLAPNHSFIQYFDKKGDRFNFETTNGNLVSEGWLAQNTFITSTALKNKIYLDTLSSRMLFAECLGDFLESYFTKMRRFDDFSNALSNKILTVDPNNLTALMERANLANRIFQIELQAAGNPSENAFSHFPKLYAAYRQRELCYQTVAQSGFQRMPKEAYQTWLKSLDEEKQKQQNREEQARMEREIRQSKSSKLINNRKE